MITIISERQDYTDFGADLKYNCDKLLKLAEQIDAQLTEFSGDVENQDELNATNQLVLSLNHEIKCMSTTWNSIHDEYLRLESLSRTIKYSRRSE